MSLAESQRLLARLYTDAALRRRFFAAPEDVGRQWELTVDEARSLASSREQVERFARALEKKHLRGVRQLLPRTAALLGAGLGGSFSAYVESHEGRRPPEGPRKIPNDALRFAAFLERHDQDELIRAVARFEAAWVRAHGPGFRFTAGVFPFRMNDVVRRLDRGEEPSRVRRPSLHVWWRFGRLRHASLV